MATTTHPVRLQLVDEDVYARIRWSPRTQLLEMIWPDGEAEVLNCDLTVYGYAPQIGEVFLKDWSEHEGLTASLVEAGIVTWTGSYCIGPFNSRAYRAAVLVDNLAVMDR